MGYIVGDLMTPNELCAMVYEIQASRAKTIMQDGEPLEDIDVYLYDGETYSMEQLVNWLG